MICEEGVLDGTDPFCCEATETPPYRIPDNQGTGKHTGSYGCTEGDGEMYLPEVFKGVPRKFVHRLLG